MNRAIVTKYLPASGFKGSRIKATAQWWTGKVQSVTVGYPYSAPHNRVDHYAAQALCTKLGLFGDLIDAPLSGGHVFILQEHQS
jgi:hypothetical protein